jgi:predicted nuclease of predicted toxin-antitoxin system
LSADNPFRVLLDAGVPDSVGHVFEQRGHTVIFHREVLTEGAPDEVVCFAALTNEAILIAVDGDMKRLAKRYGAAETHPRLTRLNLIRIGCNPVLAAQRVDQSMSLIEHEWAFSEAKTARRLWVDIGPHFVRTNR